MEGPYGEFPSTNSFSRHCCRLAKENLRDFCPCRLNPRQFISTARIAMRCIASSKPKLGRKLREPVVIAVGHYLAGTACSSANIFFCEKRHALIHGRAKAHNDNVQHGVFDNLTRPHMTVLWRRGAAPPLSNAETRDGRCYRILGLLPMGGKSPCISASQHNTHHILSTL